MKLTIAILVAAGISSIGCSWLAPDSAKANSDLKQSVQVRLVSDPQLSQVQVNANAAQNQVTLSGSVSSEDARREAVDLAKSVTPPPIIIDNIDVKPVDASSSSSDQAIHDAREKAKVLGDKIGASLDDAWVYTRVEAKLVGHSAAPALKINVDVENNVVTLRGVVQSAAMKEEAERIARETEGVRDVRNLLQVRA